MMASPEGLYQVLIAISFSSLLESFFSTKPSLLPTTLFNPIPATFKMPSLSRTVLIALLPFVTAGPVFHRQFDIGDLIGSGSGSSDSSSDSSSSSFSSSTQNGLSGDCKAVTVIFARGTSETGNVGTVTGPPFFEALAKKVGDAKLAVQGVEYAADAAGIAEMGDSAGSKKM